MLNLRRSMSEMQIWVARNLEVLSEVEYYNLKLRRLQTDPKRQP